MHWSTIAYDNGAIVRFISWVLFASESSALLVSGKRRKISSDREFVQTMKLLYIVILETRKYNYAKISRFFVFIIT